VQLCTFILDEKYIFKLWSIKNIMQIYYDMGEKKKKKEKTKREVL
jgi:hypothetical protein